MLHLPRVASVIAFALSAWTAVSSAQDAAGAKAVIDKAIAAAGGEKFVKFPAASWKAKGVINVNDQRFEFTGEWHVQFPNRMRRVLETDNGIKLTVFVDGDKTWTNAGANIGEVKDAAAALRDEMYVQWVAGLACLRRPGFETAVLGDAQVDGRAAVQVRVTRKERPQVLLYFDKGTHLLVKHDRNGGCPYGLRQDNFEEERTYSDYKEFDGIKRPTRVVVKRDGKVFIEMDRSEIQPLEKLDDAMFARTGN